MFHDTFIKFCMMNQPANVDYPWNSVPFVITILNFWDHTFLLIKHLRECLVATLSKDY